MKEFVLGPIWEKGRRGTRKLNIQGLILGCVGRVSGGGTEGTHMDRQRPVLQDVLHNRLMSLERPGKKGEYRMYVQYFCMHHLLWR